MKSYRTIDITEDFDDVIIDDVDLQLVDSLDRRGNQLGAHERVVQVFRMEEKMFLIIEGDYSD